MASDLQRMNRVLQIMQAEFESNRLEVGLVPQKIRTNEGGMIRVAFSKNCEWYRKLCASYPSGRTRRNSAPDTRIKRANIASVISRLCAGRDSRSRYVDDILRFARTFPAARNSGRLAEGRVAKGKRSHHRVSSGKVSAVQDWPF